MLDSKYTKERFALKALRLKWPDAKVTNEHFNLNFSIEFANGEYGYAGFSNGPLGVDLFKNEAEMAVGNPYDSVEVEGLFDRVPMNFDPDGWEEEFPLSYYNESGGMTIIHQTDDKLGKYRLEVMIDRGEEVCGYSDSVENLMNVAVDYMYMLEAATGVDSLIDAPGILLHPQTNEYQLTNYDDSNGFGYNWFPKRPFNELLDILYGLND